MKVSRGFTLIELLVVIAIIGILASIVLVSLAGGRLKSRDGQRVAELKEMQKALELYYSDHRRYPITACAAPNLNWTSFDSSSYSSRKTCASTGGAGVNTLSDEMAPYISALKDPKNLGTDAGFLYTSPDGQKYCFMSYRNPENMNDFSPGQVNPVRCPTIANGQCTSGTNSIFVGTGSYATAGC